MEKGWHLLEILERNEAASGQVLNRRKTSRELGSVRDNIQALFGARVTEDYETYLGLPMVGGK